MDINNFVSKVEMEDFDPSKEELKAEVKVKKEEEEEADRVGLRLFSASSLSVDVVIVLMSLHFRSCVRHCSVSKTV